MIDIPGIIPEFSRPFPVDKISTAGKRLLLEATEEERAALCERFALLAIERLTAEVFLEPLNGVSLVRLKGRLAADVIQQCIVTLEPLSAHIDETFSLIYTTDEGDSHKGGKEIVVEMDEMDDSPELIVGGMIDTGEAVAEHLALALDPFPRGPNAFNHEEEGENIVIDKKPVNSPFASLSALTKKKH